MRVRCQVGKGDVCLQTYHGMGWRDSLLIIGDHVIYSTSLINDFLIQSSTNLSAWFPLSKIIMIGFQFSNVQHVKLRRMRGDHEIYGQRLSKVLDVFMSM